MAKTTPEPIASRGAESASSKPPLRVASVSYLNAKPLIYGLESQSDIKLTLHVPSKLAEELRQARCDVALLPVVDYQRLGGLCIVPSGGIGCDGPTLTVRIFSPRPIGQIRTLACDTDSHTSVALARIVLAELYGIHPEFVDLAHGAPRPVDATLLIGDKVVCEEPPGMPHQLDLGAAWKSLTGMPFVFAAWCARAGADLRDLPQRLAEAREKGLQNVESIVQKHAVARGWPAGVAWQYLTVFLKFEVGDVHLHAIERFFELAHRHGILPSPPAPLLVHRA